jgi:hypothetical protein
MSAPKRIQLSRKKGWRKPAGAVVVSRPSRWGNPFKVGARYMWMTATDLLYPLPTERDPGVYEHGIVVETCTDAATAVGWYRAYLQYHPSEVAAIRARLAGKDLACWCKPGDPCHADDQLALANPADGAA